MAGTKEELKKREMNYTYKLSISETKKEKAFWQRQLNNVRKQIYGHK